MTRSCVDLFVFDDRIIELTEDLTLGVEGLRESPSGAIMSSIIGVTVNPSVTTVEIEDNDGEERVNYSNAIILYIICYCSYSYSLE